MTRMADYVLCPTMVRTGKTLHLPGCPSIKGRQTWPCKWAEGRTLGEVYDSLGPGKVKPCKRCDPLFLPGHEEPFDGSADTTRLDTTITAAILTCIDRRPGGTAAEREWAQSLARAVRDALLAEGTIEPIGVVDNLHPCLVVPLGGSS